MFISSLLCFSPRGDSRIKIMALGQNFEKNQSPKRYSRRCFVGVGCYFFIPIIIRHKFSNNSFNDNDFFNSISCKIQFPPRISFLNSPKCEIFSLSLYRSKEITNNYFIHVLVVIKKLHKLCWGEETSNIQLYTCYISREGVWSDEASFDNHLFVTDAQYCYDSLVEIDTSRSEKNKLKMVRDLPSKIHVHHVHHLYSFFISKIHTLY